MFYQKELDFIINVLQKSHIDCLFITQSTKVDGENENIALFDTISSIKNYLPKFTPKMLYKLEDAYGRFYRFLLLPNTDEPTVLCIGPYLHKTMQQEDVLEIVEKLGFDLQNQSALLEYYYSLSVLQENSPIFTMLNAFCETIWQNQRYTVKDISTNPAFSSAPISKTMLGLEHDDTLVNKKAIERRYAFENELIRAVSLGQTRLMKEYNGNLLSDFLEKRTKDPLQNAKNYVIIMNTLLRKGAESGGVHPIYLDQTSSLYANKIENLTSVTEGTELMKEMVQGYCKLVQKHSIKKYTQVVQETILIIDGDLSADLSPNLLAKSQGVTLGYLSTVFKKETGKTISEYVSTRRMEYAEHLLKTTSLQIQTIALHCGIMDAQYFSKQFKKYCGKTPFEYRRNPTTKK